MSIKLGTNFDYKGKHFLDDRQQPIGINNDDNIIEWLNGHYGNGEGMIPIPNGFEVYCDIDKNWYTYNGTTFELRSAMSSLEAESIFKGGIPIGTIFINDVPTTFFAPTYDAPTNLFYKLIQNENGNFYLGMSTSSEGPYTPIDGAYIPNKKITLYQDGNKKGEFNLNQDRDARIDLDGGVQSDWNEDNVQSAAYIKNKPDIHEVMQSGNGIEIDEDNKINFKNGDGIEFDFDGNAKVSVDGQTIKINDSHKLYADIHAETSEDALLDLRIGSITINGHEYVFKVPREFSITGDTFVNYYRYRQLADGKVVLEQSFGEPEDERDWSAVDGSVIKLITDENVTAGLITKALYDKLNLIESGAQKNVQSDWTETDEESDSFIKNKPAIPTVNNGAIKIYQNSVLKGTFNLNQSNDVEINLDNGETGGSVSYSEQTGKTEVEKETARNNIGAASQDEMDFIYGKLFPIKMTTSGGFSATIEYGDTRSFVNPTLSWNLFRDNGGGNIAINTVSITSGNLPVDGTLSEDKKSFVVDGTFIISKDFQSKSYGILLNSSYTGNVQFIGNFDSYKYYGASSKTELENEDIIGMSKEWSGNNWQMVGKTFDCTGGKYPYYIIPSSLYNAATFKMWIGGLRNTDFTVTEQTVTNQHGYEQSYKVIRLNNIQNAPIPIDFKN